MNCDTLVKFNNMFFVCYGRTYKCRCGFYHIEYFDKNDIKHEMEMFDNEKSNS